MISLIAVKVVRLNSFFGCKRGKCKKSFKFQNEIKKEGILFLTLLNHLKNLRNSAEIVYVTKHENCYRKRFGKKGKQDLESSESSAILT